MPEKATRSADAILPAPAIHELPLAIKARMGI